MRFLTEFDEQKATEIAYEHGIEISFREGMYTKGGIEISGSANTREGLIYINVNRDPHRCWEVLFHEVGHVLDYRDGKFNLFYNKDAWRSFKCSEDMHHYIKMYRIQSVRAERSADSRGRDLFKAMFPNTIWNRTYVCASTLSVLRESTREYFEWMRHKYLTDISKEAA